MLKSSSGFDLLLFANVPFEIPLSLYIKFLTLPEALKFPDSSSNIPIPIFLNIPLNIPFKIFKIILNGIYPLLKLLLELIFPEPAIADPKIEITIAELLIPLEYNKY